MLFACMRELLHANFFHNLVSKTLYLFLFFTVAAGNLFAEEVHYGDMIVLRHVKSKAVLCAHDRPYYHDPVLSSDNQYNWRSKDGWDDNHKLSDLNQVSAKIDGIGHECWFVVMPKNVQDYGKKISTESLVRLQHVQTRTSLSSIQQLRIGSEKKSELKTDFVSPSRLPGQQLVACMKGQEPMSGFVSSFWKIISSGDGISQGSSITLQDTTSQAVIRYLASGASSDHAFDVACDGTIEQEVYTVVTNTPDDTQWEIARHFAWTQLQEDFYAKDGTSMAIVGYHHDGSGRLIEINDVKVGEYGKAYHLMRSDEYDQSPERSFSLFQNDDCKQIPMIGIKCKKADKRFLLAREKAKKEFKVSSASTRTIYAENEVLFQSDKFGDYEQWEVVPTMQGTFKLRNRSTDNYLALCEPWDDDTLFWTAVRNPATGDLDDADFADGMAFTFNAFGKLKNFDGASLSYKPMEALFPLTPGLKVCSFEQTSTPEKNGLLVTCTLRASQGGWLRLQNNQGRFYDICLGINNDTQSLVRKGFSSQYEAPILKVCATKDLFSQDEDRPFWLHYQIINNVGFLSVGTGTWSKELNNVFLIFADDAPLRSINQIGFGGCGALVNVGKIAYALQSMSTEDYGTRLFTPAGLGTRLAPGKLDLLSLPAGSGTAGSYTKQDKEKAMNDYKAADKKHAELKKNYDAAVKKSRDLVIKSVDAAAKASQSNKKELVDAAAKLKTDSEKAVSDAAKAKDDLELARKTRNQSALILCEVKRKS